MFTPLIKAVTFDFWNTVMWEEPGSLRRERFAAWRERLNGRGPSQEELEAAHDAAHRAYERAWRENRQFRVPDAVEQIASDLRMEDDSSFREVLADGFDEGGRRAAVHACDGIHECLGALRDAGVGAGIVCDIGLTPSYVVRELLARERLLGLFDHTSFSDEVGDYKPAAAIFEHALSGLGGVEPAEAAHIGDRRRTDVGGAIAMGMTAVRYNGVYEDPEVDAPEAPHVISHLSELPTVLGVGPRR
jgi:putative hydrolase of the HAD superfamily